MADSDQANMKIMEDFVKVFEDKVPGVETFFSDPDNIRGIEPVNLTAHKFCTLNKAPVQDDEFKEKIKSNEALITSFDKGRGFYRTKCVGQQYPDLPVELETLIKSWVRSPIQSGATSSNEQLLKRVEDFQESLAQLQAETDSTASGAGIDLEEYKQIPSRLNTISEQLLNLETLQSEHKGKMDLFESGLADTQIDNKTLTERFDEMDGTAENLSKAQLVISGNIVDLLQDQVTTAGKLEEQEGISKELRMLITKNNTTFVEFIDNARQFAMETGTQLEDQKRLIDTISSSLESTERELKGEIGKIDRKYKLRTKRLENQQKNKNIKTDRKYKLLTNRLKKQKEELESQKEELESQKEELLDRIVKEEKKLSEYQTKQDTANENTDKQIERLDKDIEKLSIDKDELTRRITEMDANFKEEQAGLQRDLTAAVEIQAVVNESLQTQMNETRDRLDNDIAQIQDETLELEEKLGELIGELDKKINEMDANFKEEQKRLQIELNRSDANQSSMTEKLRSELSTEIEIAKQRSEKLQEQILKLNKVSTEVKERLQKAPTQSGNNKGQTNQPSNPVHYEAKLGGSPRFYQQGGGGDTLLINFPNGVSIDFKKEEGFNNYSDLIKHYLMKDKKELIEDSSNEISEEIHGYLTGNIELKYGPDEKLLYKRQSCEPAYKDYMKEPSAGGKGGSKNMAMLPIECYIDGSIKGKIDTMSQTTMLKLKSPFIEDNIDPVELRKDLKWVEALNEGIFVKLHDAVEINGQKLTTESGKLDQDLKQFIDNLKTLPNIRQSITYMDPDFPDYLKGFETQEREKIEGLKSTIEREEGEHRQQQENLKSKLEQINHLLRISNRTPTQAQQLQDRETEKDQITEVINILNTRIETDETEVTRLEGVMTGLGIREHIKMLGTFKDIQERIKVAEKTLEFILQGQVTNADLQKVEEAGVELDNAYTDREGKHAPGTSEDEIKKSQNALDKAYAEYKELLDNTFPIISYFEMGNIAYFYINERNLTVKGLKIELDSSNPQEVLDLFIKDEEIKEDVVHCYKGYRFEEFQKDFYGQRFAKGVNVYNVDFEQAQKDKPESDGEKMFEYLRDELFYKTYSKVLRTYLKSDKEKLMDIDSTTDFDGLFYDPEVFKKNYGSQKDSYYDVHGKDNFGTYDLFIKEVNDKFTEKIKWLNNQIKISNESGKNTMECVYGTADKLGMERGKIDQAIDNEEEFKKVIDELNEYRKTIGLLPFTKIDETTTTPSDEGGDEATDQTGQPGEPGDEELDQISIKNLNGLLTYAKGILNNSKTSESSKELMAVSREIQDFTNDSEFNKFLIKSAQSLANRRPAEPVNEDELPEDSPILVEQKNRTLYLKISGINVVEQSITKENVPKVDLPVLVPPNGFSDILKDSNYKFFINDKELVISLADRVNADGYKVGMNVRFNETIDIGKITKINKGNEGYRKYNSNDIDSCKEYEGPIENHLVIDVGLDISKFMEQVVACSDSKAKPFTGFYGTSGGSHSLNIKLSDSAVEPEQPNFYSLVFNSSGLQDNVFKFTMDSSFDSYKSSPKPSYGPVLDEKNKELYGKLLTKIFTKFNLDWTDTFTLEGMKYVVDSDDNGINLSLIAGGSLRTVIPKLKDIEKAIQSMGKETYEQQTSANDIDLSKYVSIEDIKVSTRDEKFSKGSYGVKDRKIVPGVKMKILKKSLLGAAALGLAGPGGLALYGAKQVYDSKSQKTTADPTKAFKTPQSGGADSSWTGSVVTSKEKRSLERLKKSLDYNFNSETENNKGLKDEVTTNNNLKSEIKEDILEIIGEVEDNPVSSEPKEKGDKKTKEMEDKLLKLIQEQNKNKSSSANADLTRQISALKGQLAQQRSQQQPRSQQQQQQQKTQTLKPGQQPVKPGQQPVKPGQQPVKPGQQPVKPGQQPGQPPTAVQGEQGQTGPSLFDRLFGSSSSEKEQLDRERQDFERDKEDELKEKKMKERMEELKKEETIQTDLFKQLPDKSSPEYERVKKLMIEQIKLIHKYNLLKQETFQLMLENSKCEDLVEENREQKEQIKDLENKIFSIIQQILSSKTSNRGLNKLNRDLLSYIDDLKSTNPDGSLVDTEKYLDLIQSFKSSSSKKTLKKVQKKKSTNKTSDKDEKKKKTPNKLRKKFSPKKKIQKSPNKPKKTPTKPKMTKVYKGKSTPKK